jgi:hypothetical protein
VNENVESGRSLADEMEDGTDVSRVFIKGGEHQNG